MSFYFSEFRQLKRNEAAKALRRDAQLKKKKDIVDSKGYSNIKEFDFPEVSKKELKTIKENIRRKSKNRKNKNLAFIVTLLGIASILIFSNIDYSIRNEIVNEDNYLSDNINEYSYLIDDGDKWIEKGHWNNAIYRYKDAVKLFPEKSEAKYRLALAYSYNCNYNNKNCEIGTKLTDQLLKYQPDELDFIKLKVTFQDYTRKRITNN